MQGEGSGFVYGKGKHKPEIQKLYEVLEECGARLMDYKECFEIMGKDRNSYSKTDLETAFMTKGPDPADERGSYDERAVKIGL